MRRFLLAPLDVESDDRAKIYRDTCPGGRCQGAREEREVPPFVFFALFAGFAVQKNSADQLLRYVTRIL